jgi:hypothetical protein
MGWLFSSGTASSGLSFLGLGWLLNLTPKPKPAAKPKPELETKASYETKTKTSYETKAGI